MDRTPARAPAPLELHLRGDDRDETRELVGQVFPDFGLRLSPPPDGAPMRMRVDVLGDERFTWQRAALSAGGAGAGSIEGYVIGQRRRPFGLSTGRTEIDTSRPFMYPDQGFAASWTGFDNELVSVRRDLVEAAARRLAGDERHRLRFTGWSPVSREAGVYWNSVRQYVVTTVTDPGALSSPLVRGELLRSAVRAMLLVFPNSAAAAEPGPTGTGDRRVQAAADWIEANAGRDIDLADVAAAVAVPARRLSERFRDQRGVTPLQYLRAVRFERARGELLGADPDGTTTVAEVALGWGFASPGRFAVEYRRRFGESPSATLAR